MSKLPGLNEKGKHLNLEKNPFPFLLVEHSLQKNKIALIGYSFQIYENGFVCEIEDLAS